jgi:hypothetical protein
MCGKPLFFSLKLASATKRIPQEIFVVLFNLNEKEANV